MLPSLLGYSLTKSAQAMGVDPDDEIGSGITVEDAIKYIDIAAMVPSPSPVAFKLLSLMPFPFKV